MPTELITVAPWHDSIGDAAIEQATITAFAEQNIALISRACILNKNRAAIFGGGRVLSPKTKDVLKNDRFAMALQQFQIPGPHIINAAEATHGGDYSYLSDYLHVSVRDQHSFNMVKDFCNPILAPCTAAMMTDQYGSLLRRMPGYGWLDRQLDEPYIIVDCDLPIESELKIVRVDTRYWAERPCKSDIVNPFRRPEVLCTLLEYAEAALCSSLHLSILAAAQKCPFVIHDETQQTKRTRYWKRAGVADKVCCVTFDEMLPKAFAMSSDVVTDIANAEYQAALENVTAMAEIIKRRM